MKLKILPILSSLTTMLIFSGCSAGSNDSANTSQLNMTLKPVESHIPHLFKPRISDGSIRLSQQDTGIG